MQVVAPRVVAGPALVGAGVVQRQPSDSQHAHAVGAVCRVDGDAALAGAVPQLPEGVAAVDLRVPPLDLRRGVPHHVAVQLKGVARELGLRQGRLDKAGWTRLWSLELRKVEEPIPTQKRGKENRKTGVG